MVAVIVVLFCLGYFAMAAIPFLFVRLDIPEVWRLFRGLFDTYFRVTALAGILAAAAFAISGEVAFPMVLLLLSGTAIAGRKTVMERIDHQQDAGRSGDPDAMRRLRRIHWSAMLVNLGVLAFVAGSIDFII